VLEAPIPVPGVRSPDNPLPGPAPNLASSNGFEGMAISPDGRTLYPTLEGPLADDADKTIRRSFTFDIAKRRYEPGYRVYHIADPTYLVSDLTALDSKRFVSLERDNLQGPAALHKQAFVWDGHGKREVLDELNIADPKGISLRGPVRPGDFGLGDPFRMPYQTIEAVLPVDRDELAIVNDTNFGSTGPQRGAAGLQRLHPRAGSSHSEKVISPHSWREWSSRRATWSSISRETAAGSK
jgi:glycerophosphoryl diester phosphodiesterase